MTNWIAGDPRFVASEVVDSFLHHSDPFATDIFSPSAQSHFLLHPQHQHQHPYSQQQQQQQQQPQPHPNTFATAAACIPPYRDLLDRVLPAPSSTASTHNNYPDRLETWTSQLPSFLPALATPPQFGVFDAYDFPLTLDSGAPSAQTPPEPSLQSNSQQWQAYFDCNDFAAHCLSASITPTSPNFISQNIQHTLDQSYTAPALGCTTTTSMNASGEIQYLTALAGNFSSPSLPPINSSPRIPPRSGFTNLPKPLEVGEAMISRSPWGSGVSSSGVGEAVVDLTKEEPSDFNSRGSGIDLSTPTLTMPPTTRRRSSTTAESPTRNVVPKRRRPSTSSSNRPVKRNRREVAHSSLDTSFDDDDDGRFPRPFTGHQNIHESIDLSNATEVPEELKAPKEDKRVKLGKFQCVICMDNVTALTVTHCGHLFCSECLHSSLHIDSVKKCCPVCRTKVELKDKKGKNVKSYYHLELKIMTAVKKGKRPAG